MRTFIHDCKRCVDLGVYIDDGIEHDLYFCEQFGVPTVIARYGNSGGDYISGLSKDPGDIPLREARLSAIILNLIKE